MPKTIKEIIKRDGRIVKFDQEKITNAIFKALECVGEPNFDLAKELSQKVVTQMAEQKLAKGERFKVEQIQDIVEQVLVEEGQAKVAKSYILYRQKRAEIRQQKQQILNKSEIDEVDKKFDLNSLRVLCSRYLRKDEQGNVIESPKGLFERVALHTLLPSLLYDKRVFQKKPGNPLDFEDLDSERFSNKYKLGRFVLNKFHLEGFKDLYSRLNKDGLMKIKFSEVLTMLEKGDFNRYEQEGLQYFDSMVQRKFFPNTPALANFGSHLGMGSACFALGVEDSIESIMGALKKAAIIFKSGGGVGYNFSNLRPKGDFVKTTGGLSSGPIIFMTLFDKMTDVVKQGGIRRGASMGILDIRHPDIEDFIIAKKGNQALRNFNISVLVQENFWDCYEKKKPFPLLNPRTGQVVKYVDPQQLFELIVYQAWESAEPGVLFEDSINKYNPFLETLGLIKITNPCSELPLFESESCNLGSINVWAFCKKSPTNGRKKDVVFDWEDFRKTISIATRFLDNVIDINKYPLSEIEEMTLRTRKIGLGIMGLANVLYELEIPYNLSEGLDFMEKLMEFLNYHSKLASIDLARERGRFPYYKKSFYPKGKLPISGVEDKEKCQMDWQILKAKIKKYGLRHSQTTTNAPTGSISMIAGASSGIEPCFSLVFEKEVTIGSFYFVDPVFEKTMEREGLFDDILIKEISDRGGSVQKLGYIPARLKKIFVTATDIMAKDHIKALASLQKWTDSSISKTINFPSNATVDDMRSAYLLAYKLGCKGLTVFRDKSIKGVLSVGVKKERDKKQSEPEMISLKDEKAQGPVIFLDPSAASNPLDLMSNNGGPELCPKCRTPLVRAEGCKKCPKCGWGVCSG